MPTGLSWKGGREERRSKRRASKRSLKCELLERRDLLSSQSPLAAPVLPGAPSSGGSNPAASQGVPLGGGVSSATAQEPDISIYDGPFVYDGFAHGAFATAANSQDFLISGSFTYTYNGSSDPPTNAGSYTVVATFTSSDPNYANGTETSTMVIAQATPRMTLTGGTFSFDANPHPAVATDVGVDGVTPVSGSFSFTYNGSSTLPTNPGSYAVVASFTSADPNYANATATATVSINTIPTGVTVTGASTTSVTVAWNPVLEPAGATPTYNIYERILHTAGGGKGSRGGYYTYNLVASGLTTASDTITGLAAAPAGGVAKSHSYVVTSVLNGVSSPYSTLTSGAPLYGPALNSYFLLNGSVWYGSSPLNVTVGQTVQLSVSGYGNPAPTYSVGSGPSFVSIDPNSGVISISPTAADVGNFTATFAATNSLGSVTSSSLSIHVLALPTVVVTGGTVVFDGNTHGASAVAYGSDGVTPLTGTFSFQYAPVQVPTALSSGEYAEVGSYIVQATFISGDPNYGNAVGTGTLTISPAVPTVNVAGSFVFDGLSHGATGTAVGVDGTSPVNGIFSYTYNGSTTEPTAPGAYTVLATFTSDDPDYDNAIGTGTLTIAPTAPTVIVNDGSFGFDGLSHPATATAVGLDGVTPIDGAFAFTYNGSPDEPTAPGTYAVLATFTSNTSDYANTIASGTIVVGTLSAPSTTITIGTTETYTLSGTPTGGGLTHVINNSTAGTGLNVVGANQVGVIEGAGNTTVGDGSSLIANSIVQGRLVIGGSAGSPAVVTIAASDASGNPLSVATSGSPAAAAALPTSTGSAAVQAADSAKVQITPGTASVVADIANVASGSTANTSTPDEATSTATSAPNAVESSSTSATAPQIARNGDSSSIAGSQRGFFSSGDVLAAIDSIFADDFGSDSPGPLMWMHHHPRL
jgi:hypothetical protein